MIWKKDQKDMKKYPPPHPNILPSDYWIGSMIGPPPS